MHMVEFESYIKGIWVPFCLIGDSVEIADGEVTLMFAGTAEYYCPVRNVSVQTIAQEVRG